MTLNVENGFVRGVKEDFSFGDAVSYAARVLGADIVLDIATLTGAQLIATGKTFAAVVTG